MINKIVSPLVICALLSACGGGGGNDTAGPDTPAPAPAPAAVLTLASPTIRTISDGSAIPLNARLSTGGAVRWQLAAGAPGTLSATTGDTVRYVPPAGWKGTPAPVTVTVTASGDGASASVTLAVAPDPGQPGVTHVPWRTETEPTMLAPVDVAADLAGNIYILVQVRSSPTRMSLPSLSRIAPDGTLTSLIGKTWFGQPASTENASRIEFASGFTVDRAGNLYFTIPARGAAASILKITPAGVITVLAGGGDTPASAIADGTGSAAKFLAPNIAGIDNDDNLYVVDSNDTPRKVTPAGVVTTLAALPAGLNADMSGNTYRYDAATSRLLRTAPDGTTAVETGVQYCADLPAGSTAGCLDAGIAKVVPVSGASLVTLGARVNRVVLKH